MLRSIEWTLKMVPSEDNSACWFNTLGSWKHMWKSFFKNWLMWASEPLLQLCFWLSLTEHFSYNLTGLHLRLENLHYKCSRWLIIIQGNGSLNRAWVTVDLGESLNLVLKRQPQVYLISVLGSESIIFIMQSGTLLSMTRLWGGYKVNHSG